MTTYDINFWNEYEKPSDEVEVVAVPGDLVIEIGGILYLIQRENDCNNIVCFRIEKSNMTTLASFHILRKWLIAQDIIFIRVEGNTRRYKFLASVDCGPGYNVIQERERTDKNIFYIKLI